MAEIIDVIIRHPKERLSKCSVEPLRDRPDLLFFKATPELRFDATGYLLLTPDAPELNERDSGLPLLLLDSTWRLLPALESKLTGRPVRRSLPQFIRSAYPRHSKVSQDPLCGLATVEALYAARLLVGRSTDGLLDAYLWKELFLAQFTDL